MLNSITYASLSQRVRNPFSSTKDNSLKKGEPNAAPVSDADVFVENCCIIHEQTQSNEHAYTPVGAFIIALARWRIKSQAENIDWYRDVIPALRRRGAQVDGNWVCGVSLASE